MENTDVDLVRAATDRPDRVRMSKTIAGGSIGHFIEWYEWSIYGLLAGIFARQMFPAKDPLMSLISSFAVFAIGFVARPIGAIVLSPMSDRLGRRKMLSATIVMAGIGSAMIALCPTYASIGILAPIIIVSARLLQGFSAGGEFQIAVTFLNEHASSKNRALASCAQMVAIGASVLAATGVASLVTAVFDSSTLVRWDWRLPFALAALLSMYGLYIRHSVEETPAFRRNKNLEKSGSALSIFGRLSSFKKEAFVVFVMQMNTVQYYLWLIFLPIYAHLVGNISQAAAFSGSIIATMIYCIAVPVFAHVSDRIGRRPLLISSAIGFLFFTYPLLSSLQGVTNNFIYIGIAVAGVLLIALNNSVLGTVFAELFPASVRTSGIGLPYAICAALFGGTAPLAATWLQSKGGALFISLYVAVISIITLLTHVFVTPETRGRAVD
jgi:MHS family alpha-ketoglutarate permease-like MFS transporter